MPEKRYQGAFAGIAVLFLITLLLRILLVGYYHNNLGGIEPNVIYGIQRVMAGQHLYQNPELAPFAIIQYAPLYYYAAAAAARAWGIAATNVHGIYSLCRLLALLFNLATVAIVSQIILKQGLTSKTDARVLAMPLFILLTSHYYTRGDSLYLLLFTGAVYFLIAYDRQRSLAKLLAIAGCTAACIATRQSGILMAGIAGGYLLLMRRQVAYALLYGLCTSVLTFAISYLLCSGDMFACYQNVWLGLKNGIDASFLYLMFTSQFFLDMVPCYGIGVIVLWLAVKKRSDGAMALPAWGAGASFVFAMATGVKIGSSNNYLTEFLLFVVLAVPCLLYTSNGRMLLARPFRRELTISRYVVLAVGILVVSKTIGLFTAMYIERSYKSDKDEYVAELQLYQYFENELHIAKGQHIFFTERHFLDNLFIDYAIMPIKDVVSQVYLANNTTFDYGVFTTGMNNGLVQYIVTAATRDDINICKDRLPFVHFDESKFRLIDKRNGYCIYRFTGGG